MPESPDHLGGRHQMTDAAPRRRPFGPRLYVDPDDKITAYSDPAYGYLYTPSVEDANVWVPVRELTQEEIAAEEARVAHEKAQAERELVEEVQQREAAAARRARAARKSMQPEDSYTYLVGAEGSRIAKIGWALKPSKRRASLQTGSPIPLVILWTQEGAYEERLHAEFDEVRVHGEWFDFTTLGDPVEVVTAAVQRIQAAKP